MCQALCLVPSCALFWGQWMTLCDTHNSSDVMLLWKGAVFFIFFLGPLEPLKKVGSRNTGTYLPPSFIFCSPHPSSSAAEESRTDWGCRHHGKQKCPQRDVSWCVQGAQEPRPLRFFSGIHSGCQGQRSSSTWFTIVTTFPCFKLFKLQAKYGY